VPQHLNISRMRTLELQRPMLRATNTGATAVIDHRGQIVASLPAWERGVLQASVQGREGVTPYAWWAGRFGLWPLVALALAVVAWRVAGARRLRGAEAAAQ
jgi:apolipoprotein N-acyltransferase